jgi:heme-degrading monooxygenase HmoA
MFARASTIMGDRSRIDEAARLLETETLPELEHLEGFQGILSLSDRETGRTLVITLWETEEMMRSSEERANQLRSDAATRLGASGEPQVDRYEVALHEVRTPVHV